MKVKEAIKFFHGESDLNCAQAVLKAFQFECGITEKRIQEGVNEGGGRVEGGICGALHAAQLIANNLKLEINDKLICEFEEKAGSILCIDIKNKEKLTCKECVALAAYNIQLHMKK